MSFVRININYLVEELFSFCKKKKKKAWKHIYRYTIYMWYRYYVSINPLIWMDLILIDIRIKIPIYKEAKGYKSSKPKLHTLLQIVKLFSLLLQFADLEKISIHALAYIDISCISFCPLRTHF